LVFRYGFFVGRKDTEIQNIFHVNRVIRDKLVSIGRKPKWLRVESRKVECSRKDYPLSTIRYPTPTRHCVGKRKDKLK
jgi:hypothetical protein